jgi:hypothetical protein
MVYCFNVAVVHLESEHARMIASSPITQQSLTARGGSSPPRVSGPAEPRAHGNVQISNCYNNPFSS